ncbi:PilZ domain-containing protein [Virgibacillus halodenitrificans]|uniref:PilZ domain-containing protein n=1 Tax=Virgibacillus halodenitrificans TaxID=1482 RepID=UPI0013CEC36F|nr:PilZ domain-containing protein [Virgibacillus halodenitrificans]
MRYRRNAPFRYAFEHPLTAHFYISKVNNGIVKSSNGEATIIDISPDGARLNTSLHLHPSADNLIQLILTFKLNNQEFDIRTEVIWEKPKAKSYDYGVQFITDDVTKKQLTEQLKIYARNHVTDSI